MVDSLRRARELYDPSVLIAQPSSISGGKRAQLKAPQWAVISIALMASAQIALPLSPGEESLLTSLTVCLLAASAALFARNTCTWDRIIQTFAATTIFSLLIETIGVSTGWPFGHYSYTHGLAPRLFEVPLIVPLAWFAMALASREVAARIVTPRFLRWMLGGYLLAAWDLFLDPQMTHARFWIWRHAGGWQGIPLSNYLGWFVAGTILNGVVDFTLGRRRAQNNGLAFVYLWMCAMSALGFVLPFAFHRPVVGLVGGIATLPFAVAAFVDSPYVDSPHVKNPFVKVKALWRASQ